jgi:hypothetical protein
MLCPMFAFAGDYCAWCRRSTATKATVMAKIRFEDLDARILPK